MSLIRWFLALANVPYLGLLWSTRVGFLSGCRDC